MDISWDRVRSIFGFPQPPRTVWEKPFDYCRGELDRLVATPWTEINFSELGVYYSDLGYVDLQPEVFSYLFPVCLMHWHESLLHNTSCGVGDEFHHGVLRGGVLDRMVTPAQRLAIFEFFRDSFVTRLDMERGLVCQGSKTPAYGWMRRFNSLGMVMPRIDMLWNAWWSVDTPGRAVAVIQYCSGLMYYEGENPLFDAWTSEHGGGGPYLWENDSMICEAGWLEENTRFLGTTLNAGSLAETISNAAETLRGEPEYPMASRLLRDLPSRTELVEERARELPRLLSRPSSLGWSM
ncbi:MAG: hypothetical protein LLG00_01180 [Planctomycetaceae bacterium]|nr:hypothetical protein [Planctomycetaceae bacterium]